MKTTYKELKEQWRKAKVKAGDFRGLGAGRFKGCDTDAGALGIIYNSIFKDGTRRELEIEVEETCDYCWTWGDLLKAVKDANKETLTINFTVNIWNKERTNADRENLFSFTFNK